MKGRFVSIEGIDASGKTVISEKVKDDLIGKGHKAVCINKKNIDMYSPYINRFMANIKKSLWESQPNDPVSEVSEEVWLYIHTLWYKMMEEHLINKLLKENDFVILDGWYYKFLARHLVNVEFDFQYTFTVLNRLIKGDNIFFIDVKPEICWNRRDSFKPSEMGEHSDIKYGDPFDRFVSYQNKVRQKYLEFSKEKNWCIVDGNDSDKDQVVEKIVCKLLKDAY